jgi:phage tail sheath gpL-like
MTAAINLVGVAANYPNPGTYIEVDFAAGPAAGYGGVRSVLLMGNKTTAGSATNDTIVYGPDTAVTCQTETDVINLFGTGSQLHRMFLRFVAINRTTPLYFLAVSPSSGSAATATITLSTTATANGTLRVWVEDQFVDTTFLSGATAAATATAAITNINANTRWPVTASSGGSGIITLTAKNLGPEANWIRVQSAIIGTSVGTTTSLTANTFMSGGTTADSNTTALSTITASRYYYIALADGDSTNVGAAVTQVNNMAQPTTGLRQRVIYGSMDTVSNVITSATAQNAARAECVWGSGAVDWTNGELAAFSAALYTLLEAGATVGVNRKNFSLFPANSNDQNYWNSTLVPASRNGPGGAPTPTQIQSLLNNGVTPWTVLGNGATQLVKRCTTHSLNGSTNDYRIRDAHKVTVCDYWADDAASVTQQQFGGKDLLPDPAQGQPAPPTIAVTPGIWGGALKGLVTKYGIAGQWSSTVPGVQGSDQINANMIVQAETSPPTRMSSYVPLQPVNIADQFCLLVQQVA